MNLELYEHGSFLHINILFSHEILLIQAEQHPNGFLKHKVVSISWSHTSVKNDIC